jgi:parallel beta-helix repeat protein
MKKIIFLGVVFLFIGMSFTSISGIQINNQIRQSYSRSNILYVGGSGPGNYTTIQSAIDDASNGDTVYVYDDSSPYLEKNILINKPIKLIGEDKNTTIIEGDFEVFSNIIKITADCVTVNGFNIQKSGAGVENSLFDTGAGVNVIDADNIQITNNIIQNNLGPGVRFHNSSNSIIKENLIQENHRKGILIVLEADHITITLNTVRNNTQCGIFIKNAEHLEITDNNIIFNSKKGLVIIETFHTIVKRNNFYKNKNENNAYCEFEGQGYWNQWEDYLEYRRISNKAKSLQFDSNFWDKKHFFRYSINGKIILIGPFLWIVVEYQYTKYDENPAEEPYDIPGWDAVSIPEEYSYEEQTTKQVTIPRDKSTDNMLLLRLLERFPVLQKLIQQTWFGL